MRSPTISRAIRRSCGLIWIPQAVDRITQTPLVIAAMQASIVERCGAMA
jgi:hypothetical protein